MSRAAAMTISLMALVTRPVAAQTVQRFPPPDFETGHQLPVTTTPPPPAPLYDYLDAASLTLTLGLAAYLIFRRRSRRGVLALTVFSLIYFGFWRKGCVCPIGAIQNVTLAIADASYTLPWVVLLFFSLPLLFALFFGRAFCAAACPLGAIQEVVAIRPVRVPTWLEHALGLVPHIYLGAAVLFAATGSAFVICRYDPFVGIFRLSGELNMLVFGACLLVIGLFVGRPYCRFLCPYGAILSLLARVSHRRVTVYPTRCTQCRLCEDVCPYRAIDAPVPPPDARQRPAVKRRLVLSIAALPLLVTSGAALGWASSGTMSRVHPTVQLARQIHRQDAGLTDVPTLQSDAFRRSGAALEPLDAQAAEIGGGFAVGGALLGAWVGLVIGAKLVSLGVQHGRTEYEANRANCVACARCYPYCPEDPSSPAAALRMSAGGQAGSTP